ncbi:DUF1285 domain-containing protein [Reinekea marina]|uniref:DUF1285 domain-containing protein n=1 Tax=Reinekea marina TaxID=1310421 RepID=A0ABV7WRA3_9GAMM|nr:DUF1285 domain-containing protein [Reinekea marina]MDN3649512.1 DUF1285 domain-containing protein [Reinekea marina]
MGLSDILSQVDGMSDPPVEQWNPEFCGEIDIEIKRNGDWFHEGSKIGRIKLVKLFASILKREGEHFFLVTPVEKVQIKVESTPLVAVRFECVDNTLVFYNNLDQQIILDANHPIDVSNGEPAIIWKRKIPARLTTKLMYQLQLFAIEQGGLKDDGLYISSNDHSFLLEKTS